MSAAGAGLLMGVALLSAVPAQAEIFTHVDTKSGLTIISNVASARAPAIHSASPVRAPASHNASPARAPASHIAAPAGRSSAAGSAAAFPIVTVARQRTLDDGRRSILLAELASEQRALHTAAGRSERDVLQRHQVNIAALERELRATR